MRRLLAFTVIGLLAPLCTSLVAGADGESEPVPDSPMPTPLPETEAPPTTAAPPPDSMLESSTTVTSTTVAPTTTAAPVLEAAVSAPPLPPPAFTVDAPPPPPPPPTPAPTPTTALPPPSPDPTAPPTPAPAPPDDAIDPHPPAPPSQAPSGRVVVPAGAVDGGHLRPITFPVAGPVSYINDFGACRDGCRRAHRGNDIIGDRLQPLLAMHDGVVDHLVDHPTAGYGVVIRDDEGWEYRVYHVNNDTPGSDDGADDGTWRFPGGIVPGARVQAGQQIGWMGDSGNSEGSVPHAHVEIIAPGGVAMNPYWSLRRAQRDVNCRVAAIEQLPATPVDPGWFDSGWTMTSLPEGWLPLVVTGGRPRSDTVAARMWVNPLGYTSVDAAGLRVGDSRYDRPLDCSGPAAVWVATAVPSELETVLAAIRAIESGGDYAAAARSSTASGAYQFLDSSWGGYGGYRRARDAPPPVQDAKAVELATSILARNGGDVASVPVSWYIGHVPVGDEWDRVPAYPGNSLTPRQYLERWMGKYAELLGRPSVGSIGLASWTPVEVQKACHTAVVDVGDPGAPHFVLTQAQRFAADSSGRAAPAADDPCDPGAPEPAAIAAATLPERPRLGGF